MNVDFPRILTLLRKERGISQKSASAQLGISQALLSHYEKGIRECGLDFLVRCAEFYSVSCDYLLGRSPDRQGSTLTVEDLPDPEEVSVAENRGVGNILPVLNKKLIANSQSVLFDLLAQSGNKSLIGEVSAFLMLAVYRMFRVVYSSNPRNQEAMFHVPAHSYSRYTDAAMQISEANASAIASGQPGHDLEPLKNVSALLVSTASITEKYPLYASSLFNLIQSAEGRIGFGDKRKK